MPCPNRLALAALAVGLAADASAAVEGPDMLQFVNPLIGTVNGGHVFPGASLPFGMAKAVADVNTELQGGYASDSGDITGFSHMHDSGTGGGASLGNFPLFAQTGCPGDVLDNCLFTKTLRASQRINDTVRASPGYFALSLNTSVHAEMTVSNRTALYRFTFPSSRSAHATAYPTAARWQNASAGPPDLPLSPLILADLTDLSDSRSNASVAVDAQSGRITGSGTFRPSFGVGTYDLHFCADFRGADLRDAGVFVNNRAGTEPKTLRVRDDGTDTPPVPAGAWVRFHAPRRDNQILVRVGLSFLGTDQACRNAEAEIGGWDFEATLEAARDAWRQKLGVVSVDAAGVNDTLQTVLWSSLYRTMLSPQDYTGENPLWNSSEPYYDSFYCIWDSFRSIHPLLTVLDPASQTRMVRSLIDVYRFEGKLPDCRMSLCKGFTQGGSNADVVLADAYLKGLRDGIDWATGYEAVVSDAEDEPPVWSVEGRGGLASWKKLGYIPTDDFDPHGTGPFTRSISRTVEYAYDDFCIAAMAKALGKHADAEKYLARSRNWIHMFKADQRSLLNLSASAAPPPPSSSSSASASGLVDSGFQGFLQPRYLNGTFGYQDPSLCSPLYNFTSCYLNTDGHETYEGSSWLYTFYVPQDMAALVATLGGPDAFARRLAYLHETPGLLYVGDEQAFLLVYLFHYAGRPGLSSRAARAYVPSQFNDTVVGIPGNDDSGAMASFAALTLMGFWPVSGQDVYLVIPPFFREVRIRNPLTGRAATIRCVAGFDASGARNLYVQSATLDGRPYTRSWVTHDFFARGGLLELTLGPTESDWGTRDEDLPPSASTHF